MVSTCDEIPDEELIDLLSGSPRPAVPGRQPQAGSPRHRCLARSGKAYSKACSKDSCSSRWPSAIDITNIDSELAKLAPPDGLSELASHGLRAELMFAVPWVLRANPRLLGYYRLLLGLSQKSCLQLSRRRPPSLHGGIRDAGAAQDDRLGQLCASLSQSHIRLSGSSPRRYCPTVSKCSCRPCNCCETVWMSRKRRSNGFAAKIASAPAEW
jgi:hypothetical protein